MNIFNSIFKKRNNSISNHPEDFQKSLFTHIPQKQENILSPYEIIYIESQFHPHVNKYIVDNFDELKHFFDGNGKDFVYLPTKKEKLKQLILYNYPEIEQKELNDSTINLYIQDIYNHLYKFVENNNNQEVFCGLVTDNRRYGDTLYLTYYPLPYEYENEIELSTSFKKSIRKRVDKNSSLSVNEFPQYSIGDSGTEIEDDPWEEWYYGGSGYWADEYFPRESKQLIKEVWEKIDQLKEMGINHIILQKLLSLDAPRKLSRIIITTEFQIFLPDYNNIEITMSPLPKAVFILFLKHPEGILFKKLHNYKSELKEIYQQISSREDMIKSKRSISDLTDPTKNSINEKCSRIREAFVQHFDDDIAKYYYITGERSMPKKILIDRSLVEWQ
jgi:hypothetical protein